mmetsp:Transcript_110707/g.314020  ORF Transcript_110707/g.314020 Transcript_110707/m.314020 type:complete len:246 (+) Transcript_110707:306-1043(+)
MPGSHGAASAPLFRRYRGESLDELFRVWAVTRVIVPGVPHDGAEGRVRVGQLRPWLLVLRVLRQDDLGVLAALPERVAPRTDEVHDEREGVDVGLRVVQAAAHDLGRHVVEAAHEHGVRPPDIAPFRDHHLADAEVGDFDLEQLGQEEVQGLQVPVDDRRPAIVQETQASRNSATPENLLLELDAKIRGLVFPAHGHVVALEVASFHVLRDEHERRLVHHSPQKHHQVWMADGRQEAYLVTELLG